jgi:adenine-specific DNA-methyltransferase
VGIETGNLYTAFLWLSMRLLKPGGELVAITPRSFCNGPYFKPFRVALAEEMSFRRFHLFESRQEAFREDEVLQENIVFHAAKGHGPKNGAAPPPVLISSSHGPTDEDVTLRKVPASQVIRPDDKDVFINLVPDEWGRRVAEQMASLSASLNDLKIGVSTGRVVDFRAAAHLRAEPGEKPGEAIAPLIYPLHLAEGFVEWPKPGTKKPNALAMAPETASLLVEAGFYVLVKRFSSKEQKRRIMAAIYDPERIRWDGSQAPHVGFENHLNYFHEGGSGLPRELAVGLSAYLNSTLVDAYFRQFNGHTQVNATDLRSLKYPARPTLETLGRRIIGAYGDAFPAQNELDLLLTEEIFMPGDKDAIDPTQAKRRLEEALLILKALKVDRQQQNDRSALALLALLDLTPAKEWSEATNPLRGIRAILDFCRNVYGKEIAENTRETYRRQTIHQFMQAGFVALNPDNPKRPVNSPHNVYQVMPELLALVRTFGAPGWEKSLATFAASQAAIQARSLQEREMHRIPVTTPTGQTFTLSPGGQNVLIKEVLEQFCPRYTPGGKLLYVGDADDKWVVNEAAYLASLGIVVDEHGKMPDVVVHHVEKNWLLLNWAVTSHGPVDRKRHIELKELFAKSSAGLVFVTTFLDRAAMGKYLRDIAWETEVWVADAPEHLIHFNGERFLGPYPSQAAQPSS